MARLSGQVKWFSSKRGYGFIESEGGKDIFVHFSTIKSEGYKSLEKGQKVSFSVEKTEKGEQAKDVEIEK